MSDVNSRACPQCHQIDMTQKVSVLVASNTTEAASLLIRSQTALASMLQSPNEPTYQSPWGIHGCFIVALSIAAVFCFGVLITAMNFYSTNWATTTAEQKAQFAQNNVPGALIGLGITGIVLLGITILVVVTTNRTARARRAQYQTERLRWGDACAKWNKLYYCARDGVVFPPGEPGGYAPASQMSELLYWLP